MKINWSINMSVNSNLTTYTETLSNTRRLEEEAIVPPLEVLIVPKFPERDPEDYKLLSYEVIDFTVRSMLIKLDFKSPELVSIELKEPEYLMVRFNNDNQKFRTQEN
jgi:hypothetical protein